VAVTPGTTDRWEALYAARTRGEVGEGIAVILGLLGVPNVISFAGGFPDPATSRRCSGSSLRRAKRRRSNTPRRAGLPVRLLRSPTASKRSRAAVPLTTSS